MAENEKKKRIQVVGPVGTGKTFVFASLLSAIAHERRYTYAADNEAALTQMQLAVMGGRPARTREEESERFEFYGAGNTYEILSTPGEWISRSDTADAIGLEDLIRAMRNDCCILTINPFKSHQEFGQIVFVAFVSELQRKMPEMSFGDACRTAAITMFDLLWDNFDVQLGDIRWTKLYQDGGMHEEIVLEAKSTVTLDDIIKDGGESCFELYRRDQRPITDNDRKMIFEFLGEPARVAYLDSGRSNLRLMRLTQELNYEPIYFLSRMDIYGLVKHLMSVDFVAVYKRLFEGVPVSFSNIWDQPVATPQIFAVAPESNGRMRVNLEPTLAAPLLHKVLDLADTKSPRAVARAGLLDVREQHLIQREKELSAMEAELRRLRSMQMQAPKEEKSNEDFSAWEEELKERDKRIEEIEAEMEGYLAEKYEEGKRHHLWWRTVPIASILALWLFLSWLYYEYWILADESFRITK